MACGSGFGGGHLMGDRDLKPMKFAINLIVERRNERSFSRSADLYISEAYVLEMCTGHEFHFTDINHTVRVSNGVYARGSFLTKSWFLMEALFNRRYYQVGTINSDAVAVVCRYGVPQLYGYSAEQQSLIIAMFHGRACLRLPLSVEMRAVTDPKEICMNMKRKHISKYDDIYCDFFFLFLLFVLCMFYYYICFLFFL